MEINIRYALAAPFREPGTGNPYRALFVLKLVNSSENPSDFT